MRGAGAERHGQKLQLTSRDHGGHAVGNLGRPFRLRGNKQGCERVRWPIAGISHPSPGQSGPAGAADFYTESRLASKIGFKGERFLPATPEPDGPLERHLTRREAGHQGGLPEAASG